MGKDRLEALFRWTLGRRAWFVALAAALFPAGVFLATRVPNDPALSRLIVASDPDYQATQAYQRVFPDPQTALVLFEADDPFRPEALAALEKVEGALAHVQGLSAFSAVSIYRRAHPGPLDPSAFRHFATGTDLLRRQSLVGDHFLTVGLALPRQPKPRDAALDAVERALATVAPGVFHHIRRVGSPWIEAWLERESARSGVRSFPLFGALLVGIALALYRSWRAVLAILSTLGLCVACGVGLGALAGFSFSVVSSLVPLTLLVTVMATLVYLHSRYVDRPPERSLAEHQVFALRNKFLPVTASLGAAALGFGALGVSRIRPIRELGLWTAAALVLAWALCFTVFPALQRLLRAPTRAQPAAGAGAKRWIGVLSGTSYSLRWPLVLGSLALATCGAAALFGIPGRLAPMRMGVAALDYVDPKSDLWRDMRWFEDSGAGLGVARLWLTAPRAEVTDPEFLRGLDRFSRALESLPGVTAAVGPTTLLRFRRWMSGQGDRVPDDPQAFAAASADLEQLLLAEPQMRSFVDVASLSQASITVTTRAFDAESFGALRAAIERTWEEIGADSPALRGTTLRVVGESILQAKISGYLVPTLTQSFGLTVLLIFVAFLFVFKSPAARLLAMIPSLFAILVMFLVMRLAHIPLNVATILVATTVLGTTENDQIHFFHHFQERRKSGGTVEAALHHALGVSGGAIVFATLINAGGFLALAVSGFPPMRQFGIATAAAFLLSLVADFTALPAALWLVYRERPAR